MSNARKSAHGHATRGAKSPTYRAWESMLGRCERPSAGGYEFYGGRGIAVCERWHKFENFLADMGERPDGMTLDREESNGNYEPGNCRWATRKVQNRNRRGTRFITIEGRTLCLLDWCAETGINYNTALDRILNGWDPVRAIAEPPTYEIRWQPQEDAMIREFWPAEGAAMASRLAERTAEAIQARAMVLRVRNLTKQKASH